MRRQREFTHLINAHWCKGCGICVHFCPNQVLELDPNETVQAVRPEDCVGCQLCARRCPDLAITVEQKDQEAA